VEFDQLQERINGEREKGMLVQIVGYFRGARPGTVKGQI